jgi:hypothetical protein
MPHLGEGAGLTLARVREQSRQHTRAAAAELPEGLFAERPTGWRTTVRGHLLAAVDAIPDEPTLAGLRRSLAAVLAEIERL